MKHCPVVHCQLLLHKGTGSFSKTEKLIEGETRYEYIDILPNFIRDEDVSKDCGALQCKLLLHCDDAQEIVGTDILITADYRI